MVEIKLEGKYAEGIIFSAEQAQPQVLEGTIKMVQNMLNQKALEGTKVRIMPDYHVGKGCVIGTTIQLLDRVIPSYVGVDLGCGIIAYKLERTPTKEELLALDSVMTKIVPSGSNIFEGKRTLPVKYFSLNMVANNLNDTNTANSLGTLGGGNHFVEIGTSSKTGDSYLFIHSGSRGFGARVANFHIQRAIESMTIEKLEELDGVVSSEERQELMNSKQGLTLSKYVKTHREQIVEHYKKVNPKLIQQKLEEYDKRKNEIYAQFENINEDTAYLSGDYFYDYMRDLAVAQEYAVDNRKAMAEAVLTELGIKGELIGDSIHNYIEAIEEGSDTHYIVRKGATRANKGEKLVIPLNMRDGVIVAEGKGNGHWNNSAPHGSGRVFSRSQAKKQLDMNEFKETMSDVVTSSVQESTLDESPKAYKPKEEILSVVNETIKVLDIVEPIYNYKGID